jgi:hypothetical protein
MTSTVEAIKGALPKPQLMPSRIIAFIVVPATEIGLRTSCAVNSFAPCFTLCRRSVFVAGAFEVWAVANRGGDQSGVVGELEATADALDDGPEPVRPPIPR